MEIENLKKQISQILFFFVVRDGEAICKLIMKRSDMRRKADIKTENLGGKKPSPQLLPSVHITGFINPLKTALNFYKDGKYHLKFDSH